MWLNPRSNVFHPFGSYWYGRTTAGAEMSLVEALARGATAAGAVRPLPPSGVYSVARTSDGVVIKAWIGERAARAGLERQMRRAGEYAVVELAGWQR